MNFDTQLKHATGNENLIKKVKKRETSQEAPNIYDVKINYGTYIELDRIEDYYCKKVETLNEAVKMTFVEVI